MFSRFLAINVVATAAAIIPIKAMAESSGIVGDGVGLLLGVAEAVWLGEVDAVLLGLALDVELGDGEAEVLVLGVGLTEALVAAVTLTIPHMPSATCPGTGQI